MVTDAKNIAMYREGWEDALVWVLDHLELTPEDEDWVLDVLDD
jgi:hypothetical protein